ncbi:MAG: FIST signal transduction protein [Gammaproteobacteria bacterium]
MSLIRLKVLSPDTIRGALDEWLCVSPRMSIFALLPETEKQHLPLLQSACRERGIALIGALFPALITLQGFSREGAWLFRFDQTLSTFLIGEIDTSEADPASRIAKALEPVLPVKPTTPAIPTLFLIFDGLIPNISSILDSLYLRLADRVKYAGVNAGSETFQSMPCLFDAERTVANGVLGMLMPGRSTAVLEHGFLPPERVMSASSTEGNCIHSIDWRPAFDVYQEIIKTEYGIDLTSENFYNYAVHYPFGILRANGEVVVRIPVAMNTSGTLSCVGEVPENAVLVLLKAPDAVEGTCIANLAENLAVSNGPMRQRDMLGFYCAGRRLHLGEGAVLELQELVRRTGVAELAGALSLGEIGCSQAWDYPLFHNAALICMPWL